MSMKTEVERAYARVPDAESWRLLIGLAGVKRIKRELSMEKARDEAHKPRSRSHFGSVKLALELFKRQYLQSYLLGMFKRPIGSETNR